MSGGWLHRFLLTLLNQVPDLLNAPSEDLFLFEVNDEGRILRIVQDDAGQATNRCDLNLVESAGRMFVNLCERTISYDPKRATVLPPQLGYQGGQQMVGEGLKEVVQEDITKRPPRTGWYSRTLDQSPKPEPLPPPPQTKTEAEPGEKENTTWPVFVAPPEAIEAWTEPQPKAGEAPLAFLQRKEQERSVWLGRQAMAAAAAAGVGHGHPFVIREALACEPGKCLLVADSERLLPDDSLALRLGPRPSTIERAVQGTYVHQLLEDFPLSDPSWSHVAIYPFFAGNLASRPAGTDKTVARQLLQALVRLHSLGVVHADVKQTNILWRVDPDSAEEDVEIVLTDFDSAGRIGQPHSGAGSPHQMPPELLGAGGGQYQSSQDLWAAGVVIAELLTACPPARFFPGRTLADIAAAQQSFATDPARYLAAAAAACGGRPSEAAASLVVELLATDPARRPTAALALQHPYWN